MARYKRTGILRAQLKSAGGDLSGRHTRSSWSLPLFATFTTLAFVLVSLNSPFPPVAAAAALVAPGESPVLQSLVVAGTYTNAPARDGFTVTEPKPVVVAASAPAAGTPDPGTAQAIAHDMVLSRGMGEDQYSCLVALWDRESGWNVYAQNPNSGAYGIPQAYPGDKMASVADDWATNPTTQIIWGLGYIEGRWGTPCAAWANSEAHSWY